MEKGLNTQNDAIRWYNRMCELYAGSFMRALLFAACKADSENFAILLPVLQKLYEKYPQYQLPVEEGLNHGHVPRSR